MRILDILGVWGGSPSIVGSKTQLPTDAFCNQCEMRTDMPVAAWHAHELLLKENNFVSVCTGAHGVVGAILSRRRKAWLEGK